MLRRSFRAGALALFVLAACQDYNFNPVGKCVIAPAAARVQLTGQNVADILFVVDDSISMDPEQKALSANFGAFIAALAQVQADRAKAGLDPFEFHIAITTSSIYEGWSVPTVLCTDTSGTGGGPDYCQFTNSKYYGQPYNGACDQLGAPCVDLVTTYGYTYKNESTTLCSIGTAVTAAPYPSGNFVHYTDAHHGPSGGATPPVLHFTKDLNWAAGTSDPTIAGLIQAFKDNIKVGSCGSGEEQHMEASRLAISKALHLDGLAQPPEVSPSEWPHPGAKLVVVFVGDEDDCSNPADYTRSIYLSTLKPGYDNCVNDTLAPLDQQKMYKIQRYVDFLTSLVDPSTGKPRTLGAAFVYSVQLDASHQPLCSTDAFGNVVCKPGECTCQCPSKCTQGCSAAAAVADPDCDAIASTCTGKIPELTNTTTTPATYVGSRFYQLSSQLRAKNVQTFEASVCAADWSSTLAGIAQLVKPPPGLTLPTQPAVGDVVVLRIDDANGAPVHYCSGPALDQDWYFVNARTDPQDGSFKDCGSSVATGGSGGAAGDGKAASRCVIINHGAGHTCEASPGQTYVAQYLGRVPADGCTSLASDVANPSTGKLGSQSCASALGGKPADWECFGGVQGQADVGTCLCQSE